MKEGIISNVTYKKEAGGETSLLLGYIDGKKMGFILLTLVNGMWNDRVIGVSFAEDYTKSSTLKTLGLLEYELDK
ncbi:hypothetical protein LWM68_41250 [Niabella sp. W65]|nr:hypothetical protein [Niabella sp. W65]MCH7368600.1 hypothetical protein [Niabella sp. W65]ULT44188.1 hypothetical protein KRR40_12955 [Niabella sp. I65]